MLQEPTYPDIRINRKLHVTKPTPLELAELPGKEKVLRRNKKNMCIDTSVIRLRGYLMEILDRRLINDKFKLNFFL